MFQIAEGTPGSLCSESGSSGKRRIEGFAGKTGGCNGTDHSVSLGLLASLVFLGAFLYAIGFVTGLVVPKTIDAGAVVPLGEALVVNILLLSLLAIQHSVMARKAFKKW